MEPLTREELELINDLSARRYTGLTLTSNTEEYERQNFNYIKTKLLEISNFFSNKYNVHGPFITNVSPEHNPITRGNTLNYVWSTLFKGATNKQYSAQISFVIDKQDPCLNVGFYFGSASAHHLTDAIRVNFERNLLNLGIELSTSLINNPDMRSRYDSLFDIGFAAYANGTSVLPDQWVNMIALDPTNSFVIAKVSPNDFGVIENSTVDFFVSQVIFLMSAIDAQGAVPNFTPLTPEEWAKKAERNARIGLDGELFILKNEIEKLREANIRREGYPRHVALESNHYGYDILSLDNNGDEIFIEVKTTTRKRADANSRKFFISNNEIDTFENDQTRYKLYRVYDIDNLPSMEELDLATLNRRADGYYVEY